MRPTQSYKGFFLFLGAMAVLAVAGTVTVLNGNYHIDEPTLIEEIREMIPDLGIITDVERHIVKDAVVTIMTTNGEKIVLTIDSNFRNNYVITQKEGDDDEITEILSE